MSATVLLLILAVIIGILYFMRRAGRKRNQ